MNISGTSSQRECPTFCCCLRQKVKLPHSPMTLKVWPCISKNPYVYYKMKQKTLPPLLSVCLLLTNFPEILVLFTSSDIYGHNSKLVYMAISSFIHFKCYPLTCARVGDNLTHIYSYSPSQQSRINFVKSVE